MDCEPVSPLEPLQPPPMAAQEVAFVLDQVSVDAAPAFTELGEALNVTIGALPATVTVADCVADPPAPVQVNSYSMLPVRAPVDLVPLVGTLPRQLPAIMVHEVASTDFHVRVELSPLLTVVGEALKVTAGAAAEACAATDTATD